MNWVDTVLDALVGAIVTGLGKMLLGMLKSRKHGVALFLRKWSLSGLGVAYITWAIVCFLGWIGASVNAATGQGIATVPSILAMTFVFGISLGVPGMALNHVTRKVDSKHWVVRMTDSYHTTKAVPPMQQNKSKEPVNDPGNQLPYIQLFSFPKYAYPFYLSV